MLQPLTLQLAACGAHARWSVVINIYAQAGLIGMY